MVEITVAPNRFQRILNVGLVGKAIKGITTATAYFRHDGLYIHDRKSPFFGVKAFFPTHFFINYNVENEEMVCLSETMLEPFGYHKAFEQEALKVITKNNKVFYQSTDPKKPEEVWNDVLLQPEESKFQFKLPDTDKGFIPQSRPEIVQALLEVSQLRVHTCEYYRLYSDGKTLQIEVTGPGVYHRALDLTKSTKFGEISYQVSGELFEAVVGMYTGEVWLSLYEKAIIMSQKTNESSITYVFTPRLE